MDQSRSFRSWSSYTLLFTEGRLACESMVELSLCWMRDKHATLGAGSMPVRSAQESFLWLSRK